MVMTSSRPYLIRALYQWILDNGCTPYILVDATQPGTAVPQEYVKDGQIVLNITPSAVRDLDMADDALSFNARFGGVPTDVFVPASAVLGIYARENGKGMIFEPEDPGPEAPEPPPGGPKASKKPSLRVVK